MVSEKTYNERIRRAEPREGDLLFSREGTYFGFAAEIPPNTKVCLGQRMVLLQPSRSEVDSTFLRFWLNSPVIQSHIRCFRDGSVAERLNLPAIRSLPVCLPPLPEQRRIASILGALDDKIELNRQMNRTLEEMAQAIFKSWFIDFDGHEDLVESELGMIPRGWRFGSVGDIADVHDSKRIPLSKLERNNRQGPYRYFGATGVLDHIDDYLFDGIHILVGEDGSVINSDETPVVQYVWGKFWVNNHAHVLTPIPPVSAEQLLLHLKTSNVNPYITGAVQLKLNQKNLKRIPAIIVPAKICRHFGIIVDPLFARIRCNDEQTRTLAEIRDTLLPKLISGEIRVPEAAEIVEDVT